MSTELFRGYDSAKSYDWNFNNPPATPEFGNLAAGPFPGEFQFCGLPVASPLGVPAGPLLNGDWCLYYSCLGFDVLTYKTVRSSYRACYDLPNLLPVNCGALTGDEIVVPAASKMNGSWAVAFGMPSREPDFWRGDIETTRRQLAKDQLLSVSVVGTVTDDMSLQDLADDYARCAAWAVESGADTIECNFSCPNVATCDGQLYQQPTDAAMVAETVKSAIGKTPLILKIGHTPTSELLETLLLKTAPFISAVAMTNSVAAKVRDEQTGVLYFDGQKRGICGAATFEPSLGQLKTAAALIEKHELNVQLIGVGGAGTVADVKQYLASGAHAVHIATAAMTNPLVGIDIRRDW